MIWVPCLKGLYCIVNDTKFTCKLEQTSYHVRLCVSKIWKENDIKWTNGFENLVFSPKRTKKSHIPPLLTGWFRIYSLVYGAQIIKISQFIPLYGFERNLCTSGCPFYAYHVHCSLVRSKSQNQNEIHSTVYNGCMNVCFRNKFTKFTKWY